MAGAWIYETSPRPAPPPRSPRGVGRCLRPSKWSRDTRRAFVGGLVLFGLGVWVTFVIEILFVSDPLKTRMEKFGKHPTGDWRSNTVESVGSGSIVGHGGSHGRVDTASEDPVPLTSAAAPKGRPMRSHGGGWDAQPVVRSLVRHHDCDIPTATRDAAVNDQKRQTPDKSWATGALWFRRFWEPCLACADEEQLGGDGVDGVGDDDGRWVCDPERLIAVPENGGDDSAEPVKCTVLTVGVDIANSIAGFAFEREMAGRYGCSIHTYDAAVAAQGPPEEGNTGYIPGLVFHAGVSLASSTMDDANHGDAKRGEGGEELGNRIGGDATKGDATAAKKPVDDDGYENGVERTMTLTAMIGALIGGPPDATSAPLVDVVRIACEGCEHAALVTPSALATLRTRVKQLLLEVRYEPGGENVGSYGVSTGGLWVALQTDAGMLPFHKEVELWEGAHVGGASSSGLDAKTGRRRRLKPFKAAAKPSLLSALIRGGRAAGGGGGGGEEAETSPSNEFTGPMVEYGLINQRLVEKYDVEQ